MKAIQGNGGEKRKKGEEEGEKEREMAKAALTIAELGKAIYSITPKISTGSND